MISAGNRVPGEPPGLRGARPEDKFSEARHPAGDSEGTNAVEARRVALGPGSLAREIDHPRERVGARLAGTREEWPRCDTDLPAER